MFHGFSGDVPRVFQGCFEGVQGDILRVFRGYFGDVGCSEGVLGEVQGFLDVLAVLQGLF